MQNAKKTFLEIKRKLKVENFTNIYSEIKRKRTIKCKENILRIA